MRKWVKICDFILELTQKLIVWVLGAALDSQKQCKVWFKLYQNWK
jgi:hypothetical protein